MSMSYTTQRYLDYLETHPVEEDPYADYPAESEVGLTYGNPTEEQKEDLVLDAYLTNGE